MKILTRCVILVVLAPFALTNAKAEETLDTLLPPPFWLRSRAHELNINTQIRDSIEQAYMEEEPKYHDLKDEVLRLTERLHKTLIDDEFDRDVILRRMKALLDAENELKLHQVHVRVRLLSKLSTEQRQAVRELAKKKPEADWRGVMAAKVERVRQLGAEQKEFDKSIGEIEKQMKEIQENISSGKIYKAGRMLDQLIGDLERDAGKG